ncbi:uncharacterized protein LOC131657754 [Vicia villosa]|uniref:uncharacterized protein LOC131657754 n=1 Tax=Vicia villosa TaxID=3911 RepID=UPI00273C6A3E|nr:uncharacterized protein LOC131657754 [Vicia villosa]
MGEDEKVAEYVSKVQKLVHLIKGYSESLTDKMIVEKVMRAFTSHFDHVIVAIQKSNQIETLKLEDLVSSLEVQEIRIVESKIWFLDSGCSNHMIGQKVWLRYFNESKMSKVKLVDNSSLQAESTGNIVFYMSNGGKLMIKDVLYVPGMKCNLLSVGKLVEKGFSVFRKD